MSKFGGASESGLMSRLHEFFFESSTAFPLTAEKRHDICLQEIVFCILHYAGMLQLQKRPSELAVIYCCSRRKKTRNQEIDFKNRHCVIFLWCFLIYAKMGTFSIVRCSSAGETHNRFCPQLFVQTHNKHKRSAPWTSSFVVPLFLTLLDSHFPLEIVTQSMVSAFK